MSAAGLYASEGEKVESEPAFTALPLASTFAGFIAAHRIAAALISRQRSGSGQKIEVALFDACFQAIGVLAEVPWSRSLRRDVLKFQLHKAISFHLAGDGRYIENDGPVRGLQKLLDVFVPGVDLEQISEQEIESLNEKLEPVWRQKTAAEWERYGQETLKGAYAVVQSTNEWLYDEHATSSHCVLEVTDPDLGITRQAGFPVALSRTPSSVRFPRRAADADRIEILRELDEIGDRTLPTSSWDPIEPTELALKGVRVLDASTLFAGPTATRILAQYGADVIKLEKSGVAFEQLTPLSDDINSLIGHRTVNAGKRMIFLDLKSEAGQKVAHRIVESADVVHHNFTNEAAQRLGLDSGTLQRIRSDVICSRVSLHSVGGYREDYRGHELLGQAVTGIIHRLGGNGKPRGSALFLNDMATGHLAAFGILVALFDRSRTGEGQNVNSSLSRTSTMLQMPFMVDYRNNVWDEPAGRGVLGWGPFNRLYRVEDGWIYVADHRLDVLTRMASLSPFIDIERVGPGEVEVMLESHLGKLSTVEAVAMLESVRVTAHRYCDIAEVVMSDNALTRGLSVVIDHAELGKGFGIALPTLGGGKSRFLPARRPGMDTLNVLDEFGLRSQIPTLLRSKVVAVGEASLVENSEAPHYWEIPEKVPSYMAPATLAKAVERISALIPQS